MLDSAQHSMTDIWKETYRLLSLLKMMNDAPVQRRTTTVAWKEKGELMFVHRVKSLRGFEITPYCNNEMTGDERMYKSNKKE